MLAFFLYIHGSLKVKLLKFQSPVLGLHDHKLLDDTIQIIFKMQKEGKKEIIDWSLKNLYVELENTLPWNNLKSYYVSLPNSFEQWGYCIFF